MNRFGAGVFKRGAVRCTHVIVNSHNQSRRCNAPTMPGRLYCAEHAPLHKSRVRRKKS